MDWAKWVAAVTFGWGVIAVAWTTGLLSSLGVEWETSPIDLWDTVAGWRPRNGPAVLITLGVVSLAIGASLPTGNRKLQEAEKRGKEIEGNTNITEEEKVKLRAIEAERLNDEIERGRRFLTKLEKGMRWAGYVLIPAGIAIAGLGYGMEAKAAVVGIGLGILLMGLALRNNEWEARRRLEVSIATFVVTMAIFVGAVEGMKFEKGVRENTESETPSEIALVQRYGDWILAWKDEEGVWMRTSDVAEVKSRHGTILKGGSQKGM